jgi:hypothetical protein
VAQLVQGLDACGDDVRRRREILERCYLPARKGVNAAGERRRVVGFGEEEPQIRRQPFGILTGRRDDQRRARRACQQVMDEERPRPTFETLNPPNALVAGSCQAVGEGAQGGSPRIDSQSSHYAALNGGTYQPSSSRTRCAVAEERAPLVRTTVGVLFRRGLVGAAERLVDLHDGLALALGEVRIPAQLAHRIRFLDVTRVEHAGLQIERLG